MASKKPVNKKKQTYRKPRTAADKAMNAIFILLTLVFLGLAVWAVWPKVSSRIAKKDDSAAADQTQEQQQTQTVADVAEQLGISAEEFIGKYGLNADEVTAESDFSAIMGTMADPMIAPIEKAIPATLSSPLPSPYTSSARGAERELMGTRRKLRITATKM